MYSHIQVIVMHSHIQVIVMPLSPVWWFRGAVFSPCVLNHVVLFPYERTPDRGETEGRQGKLGENEGRLRGDWGRIRGEWGDTEGHTRVSIVLWPLIPIMAFLQILQWLLMKYAFATEVPICLSPCTLIKCWGVYGVWTGEMLCSITKESALGCSASLGILFV